MKKYVKKYISLTHWLAFLRRQPKHMQHVYALTISGIITTMIAASILYIDYGFWHERYDERETLVVVDTYEPQSQVVPESPMEMLSRFFGEARVQLQNVNTSGKQLLEGKEVYTNTGTSTQ